MSNIRILHVIARMNIGGSARYVGELVEKIPCSALATGYVQGSEVEDPVVNQIQIMRLKHMGRKISPIQDFKSWLELKNLINDLRPEILHTHTFKAGLIGRLVKGNQKHIHTFHGHLFGDDSFSKIEKIFIAIAERYLARRTDLLISVGNRVGDELRANGIGIDRSWLSIPPGVKALPIIDKTLARIELGLPTDRLLVGWMARMAPVKNPFMLLDLAKLLPDVRFVMAGGGELLEEILINPPGNVTILGWTDAIKFWSAVDCAVSTSKNEGMPVALIEAQLAGIPVIATDVGSNSEVIENRVTGFITQNTVEDLKAALELLVNDQILRTSMGQTARSLVTEKFSLEKMIMAYLEAYEALI